jgi:hypothetical protein
MPLHIDTAAAIRRPADQAALVRAVLAAGATDETYWLEWKSRLDLTSAEGRFMVAKVILGLANRHPDYAAPTVQGCGYLVVGVEPANLVGLPPVDAADLDAQLRRFLGQEGPQWSPTWIPIDGTHVLLITVEPPRWGDAIYLLHQNYGSFHAGTVFARRGASTGPAGPAEMAYLQDRVRRRADQFRVELALPEPGGVQPVELHLDELEAWLTAERQTLLAALEPPAAGRHDVPKSTAERAVGGRHLDLDQLHELDETPTLTLKDVEELAKRRDAGEELSSADQERLVSAEATMSAAMKAQRTRILGPAAGYEPEDRSPEAYRAEVDAYVAEAEEQAFNHRIVGAVQEGVGRLQPSLINPTERNFTKIQVELVVNESIWAVDPEELPSEPSLPPRPRPWGKLRPRSWLGAGWEPSLLVPSFKPAVPLVPDVVIDRGPPCRIQWSIDHLSPRGREMLAPVFLLIPPHKAGQTFVGEWTATARNADGVATGTLPIAIDATPVVVARLLEQQSEPNGPNN